ncbi:3-deoxy-D-manno-octulosonic acid kinase [Halomonas qinghailakensis]|uniref:3-deoxy-D-manno-octulosonic acid kinase n=1 Tax=Halomonas qinghailakensis TaxID=2937790 RepID=A0AA46TSY8_9GAMM|nr:MULTISPECIES: 3-deoxy-D-manno-octulosonic acid kinase [Halomonas]UYO75993.1 3-deoxy-D-manno-octulosonic acid kinase [Halomonas sp. ZZQ-149]
MRLAALRQKNWLILHDSDSVSDAAASHQLSQPLLPTGAPPLHPALFCEAYWRERNLVIGEAPGRGSSLFLKAGDAEQWVLRPYRRGGLIAKLSKKRYLWLGEERTRAFRELRLTATLYDQGLPVPRPVACCVMRYGLTYEAALITVRVPGARALASLLSTHETDEALLQRVGVMIKRFHQVGLDHVDLNARNILIDSNGEPWLIDLDRCRLRPQGNWQEHNIKRLVRSLTKFHCHHVLPTILKGYNS